MRRKSERNKAKSSPEKKPEKPTRKSTRRRTKKSPSTSPERLSNEKEQSPCKRQTRLRSKERTPTPTTAAVATTTTATIELMTPVIEETEAKVSSTELLLQTTPKKQDDIDDAGSVWKVARADASPGQIQKLKICRQRNLSETSDVSLSKKRSNKWQEYGEGADSADEPPTPSNDGATIINNNHGSIDDTSSPVPGRESGEEVSDSKEIPSEITTVDISDVKKNIDKQQQHGDGQGKEKERKDDDDDDHEDDRVETTTADYSSNKEELVTKDEIQSHEESHGIEKASMKPETESPVIEENQRDSPTENVESSIITDDKNIEIENKETKEEEKVSIVEKETIPEEDTLKQKASPSSSDNENDEKINEKRSDSTEKSNDESNDVEKITTTSSRPVRLTRRKHRDKYRGSSNSESGDSDDEPRSRRERTEINEKKEEESKSVDIEVSESLKDDKSSVVEGDVSESPSDEHLDIHADIDKENDREKSSDVDDNDDSNKKTSDNDETKNEQVDKSTTLEKIQTVIYKPAKVSLKRSL